MSAHESSPWLLRHWAQRAVTDPNLILLYPRCAHLSSLGAPVNSIWAPSWVKLLPEKERAGPSVLSVCFLSGVHLLKSSKSICLSLNFSIASPYLSSLSLCPLHAKHPSKLMCCWNSIYPQFFQKIGLVNDPDLKIITANNHWYFTLHI